MLKFLRSLIFFVFIGLGQAVYAHIQIGQLAKIFDYVTKHSLVILDIDNTIMRAPTALGSDQWFRYLKDQEIAAGLTPDVAEQKALKPYFDVHAKLDLVPTESQISRIVAQLKEQSEYLLVLTARSTCLAECTVVQLLKNDLDFRDANLESFQVSLAHSALYHAGILFSGPNNKGDVLLAFLCQIGYQPDHIIFVDDKEYNLDVVAQALAKSNFKTEFIGLRYAGCDHLVQAFDPVIVAQELQVFYQHHPAATA